MENKQEIHICYACNNKAVGLLSVSIISILEHKNAGTKINFYILNDGFSKDNKENFENIVSNYTNANINFISVDAGKYLKYFVGYSKYIDVSTYLRFEVFYSLSHLSKILYLDIDTMVCNDLYEMYESNIDNAYALVVAELPLALNHFKLIFNKNYSKQELQLKYFNAGVLLINIKKVLEDKVLERIPAIYEEYGKNFVFDDQDLLNILWYNNVDYIPMRYNIYSIFYHNLWFFNLSYQLYLKKEIKQLVIAHFNVDKPNQFACVHVAQKKWLDIAQKSPFYNFSKNKLIFLYVLYYVKKVFFIMLNKNHFRIKIGGLIIAINPKKFLPINFYKNKTHNIFIILGLKLSIRRKY